MKKTSFGAFLFFFCSASCSTLFSAETLSQLITDARTLAQDASSPTRQRFSNTQITEWLNVGQREVMANTNCLMGSMVFQLQIGTTYYSLPSNFLSMRRVTLGYLAMTELSPAALDGRSRGWEQASGRPTYYFVNFSSRGLVGFAPWPQLATDTDTVKIEYNIQANDLSASSDVPFNGVNELQQYDHALAYYAASMMTAIDGMNQQSAMYMTLFSNMVVTMKARAQERPNYLPSTAASP